MRMRRSVQSYRAALAVPVLVAVFTLAGGPLLGTAAAIPSGDGCQIRLNDDAYETAMDTNLTVEDPGVVTNDNICRTDGLVISLSTPTHGELHNFDDGGGGFTYIPNEGFSGTDSFTYTLEDVETSEVATVTITVTAPATTTSTTEPSTTTTGGPTSSVEATSASAPPLAVTGSGTSGLAVVGILLVGAGAIFTAAARRKRSAG